MTTETIPKAEWVYEALLTPTATERFWSKVDRRGPDECWPWTASTSAGYGQFTVWVDQHRTNLKSHRAVWMLTYGPVPVDRQVNHTCDNALCCNPAHLYAGTQGDNMRDAVHSGVKPDVILTWDKAQEIRLLKGASPSVVGRQYGVGRHAISDIWAGRTWRAPRTGFCFWCRRAVVFDDMEARRLANDEWMCGDCWAKADVGPDVPLTYEEQEGLE